MDVLQLKQLLYYQRDTLCSLELHEISDWTARAQNTHQSFSETTLCVYSATPYIHRYLVHNYTTTKLIYLMTTYYTPNDGGTANDASFNKDKVG